MQYFTLKGDFIDHPKTKELRQRYGDAGLFSLVKLWAATAKKHPDGIWKNTTAQKIAHEAWWENKPREEFADTLCEIGFLDKTSDGYAIHNWKKHQGLE